MKKFIIILLTILSLLIQTYGIYETEAEYPVSEKTSSESRTIQGYRNYTEVLQILTNLQTNYPNIVKKYDLSARYPHFNGTPKRTLKNNSIWAIKITDNPDQVEADEPAVLFVSAHHAREWITVETTLYMADILTRQYTTNSTVRNMVDNNEIWILPVLNPDGFNYSHEMDDINRSSGSGGWRKNLKETNGIAGFQDNGGGAGDGVDLNRNYGYQWGYDNSGSDPSPGGVTYRGPSAFSEIETQIMRDFALDLEFLTAVSFHSFSEVILLPWAYKNLDTPHHKVLMEMGEEMGKYNGYVHGNPNHGVLYNANGEWGDWMYNSLECLAFTFEIGTVFIPPPAQKQELARINAEAAFIAAKFAKNPCDLFESGIKGTVKDTKGKPIEGVFIETEFINYTLTATTDADGKYSIRMPDETYSISFSKDGYAEHISNNVKVPSKSMLDLNIVLKDIIPPQISMVSAALELGGSEDSTVFNSGDEVVIIVRDSDNETDLEGHAVINSSSEDYLSPELELSYSAAIQGYYTYWNTEGLGQSNDYRIETVMTDYDGNSDLNGSNESGPDLIITLLDVTAPKISSVRSRVGSDIGGTYEIGSEIRIEVYEVQHEVGLEGTVHIFEEASGFSTGVQDLTFESTLNYYYWDWDTSDVKPSSNYFVETTLTDKWGNTDLDGLASYPDITLKLTDTTAPVISMMDSFVGSDFDEVYEQGSNITFILYEAKNESGLDGYIKVYSPDVKSTPALYLDLIHEPEKKYYYASWDSATAVPYVDYYIDSALWDPYNNSDMDGADNFGPDLVLTITDTNPPVVKSVVAVKNSLFIDPEPQEIVTENKFEIGESIRIIVTPEFAEFDLQGEIVISSRTLSEDVPVFPLVFDSTYGHYYAVWDTGVYLPSNDYSIEALLGDPYDNIDPDGSVSDGPDLVLELVDTTAPSVSNIVIRTLTSNSEVFERIELGSTIRIDVFVEIPEPDHTGKLKITSASTTYDSGEIMTSYNHSSDSYSYTWYTRGLPPGDDYFLEAIFSDKYDNLDPDGLQAGPDRVLILEDTIPPVSVKGLNAFEDETEPGWIHLTWSDTEENATVKIFRSETPGPSEDNGLLISTINDGATTFVDTVKPNGRTYYYLAIIIDEHGVKNSTVNADNTAEITVSKTPSEESNQLLLMFVISIIVIIVIFLIAWFMFIRPRKKDKIPKEPTMEGQAGAENKDDSEVKDALSDGPSYEELYKDDL